MRKITLILLAAVFLSVGALAVDEPPVSADSYILVEPESGRVLCEKQADKPMQIASTTKILTALVVLDNCEIEERVEIQPEWTGIEGSSMYLKAGESYTVRELLYGLMLASGNDAATALSCYTAGSEDAFAELMEQKAASLGCVNSRFSNASGLSDDNHYSTARDLAVIAQAAIKNETLRKIFSSSSADVHGVTYYNHNKLLGCCDGVFGIKTGYTLASGRTLVSCCCRNGMELICVTLNDRDDWNDHAALYDWAYEYWHLKDCSPAPQSIPLVGGQENFVTTDAAKTVTLPLCAGDTVTYRLTLPPFVFAELEQGRTIGKAEVLLNGEVAGETEIISSKSYPRDENRDKGLEKMLKILGGNIYTF